MSVTVSLFLFLKPHDELAIGQKVSKNEMVVFATNLYQRLLAVADIVGRLARDGWNNVVSPYDIEGSHPDVRTVEEAEQRLRNLGIDLDAVDIRDSKDEEWNEETQQVECLE